MVVKSIINVKKDTASGGPRTRGDLVASSDDDH